MEKDLQKKIADWIDTGVIADVIIEELEDAGIKPTFANAKKTWLNVLESLNETVKNNIED